jgi:hypothetical protein
MVFAALCGKSAAIFDAATAASRCDGIPGEGAGADGAQHPLWSDIEAADPRFAVPSQSTEFPLVFAAQLVINDKTRRHDPYHAILTRHTSLG